jgi:hypothetical protein
MKISKQGLIVIVIALGSVLLACKILFIVKKLSSASKLMTFGDMTVEQKYLIEGYLSRISPRWREPIGVSTSKLCDNLFVGNIFCDSIVNSTTIKNNNGVFEVVLVRQCWGEYSLLGLVIRIEADEIISEDSWFVAS